MNNTIIFYYLQRKLSFYCANMQRIVLSILFLLGLFCSIADVGIAYNNIKNVNILFLFVPSFLIVCIVVSDYLDKPKQAKLFSIALISVLLFSGVSSLYETIAYKEKPKLKVPKLPVFTEPKPDRKDYKHGWYYSRALKTWQAQYYTFRKDEIIPAKKEIAKIKKLNSQIEKENAENNGSIDLSKKENILNAIWLFLASVFLTLCSKFLFSSWIHKLKNREENVKVNLYKEKYDALLIENSSLSQKLQVQKEIAQGIEKEYISLDNRFNELQVNYKSLSKSQNKNEFAIRYYAALFFYTGKEISKKELSELSGYSLSWTKKIFNEEIQKLKSSKIYLVK